MTAPNPLYVGQLNVPDRQATRQAFESIFDRRFYTNHGPLVAEFERRIADRLGVAHAICVTNGTVALMVAMKAAGLSGKAIVPAFTFPATVQSLTYAGVEPVFCDVNATTHNITADTVKAALEPGVSAIVGVHMWGQSCDVDALDAVAQKIDAVTIFDAAHSFGCLTNGRPVGGQGLCEVFSFHATKVLNCAEGGCITTNDDRLAAALRTVANFHDREGDVPVALRINAKMSEAQAAMGLLSLATLDATIEENRQRYVRFRDRLSEIPGIHFVDHASTGSSNFQYVVIEIEDCFPMSQAGLMAYLRSEDIVVRRYFYPGMHEAPPYNTRQWQLPVTDVLCGKVLQLPSGSMVAPGDIDAMCDLIAAVAARKGS